MGSDRWAIWSTRLDLASLHCLNIWHVCAETVWCAPGVLPRPSITAWPVPKHQPCWRLCIASIAAKKTAMSPSSKSQSLFLSQTPLVGSSARPLERGRSATWIGEEEPWHSSPIAAFVDEDDLELFPIRWNLLIDKDMRRNQEIERAFRSQLIGTFPEQVDPARTPSRPPKGYPRIGWSGGGAGWCRVNQPNQKSSSV